MATETPNEATARVSTYLTPEEKRQLRLYAIDHDTTPTEVLRNLVRKHVLCVDHATPSVLV